MYIRTYINYNAAAIVPPLQCWRCQMMVSHWSNQTVCQFHHEPRGHSGNCLRVHVEACHRARVHIKVRKRSTWVCVRACVCAAWRQAAASEIMWGLRCVCVRACVHLCVCLGTRGVLCVGEGEADKYIRQNENCLCRGATAVAFMIHKVSLSSDGYSESRQKKISGRKEIGGKKRGRRTWAVAKILNPSTVGFTGYSIGYVSSIIPLVKLDRTPGRLRCVSFNAVWDVNAPSKNVICPNLAWAGISMSKPDIRLCCRAWWKVWRNWRR